MKRVIVRGCVFVGQNVYYAPGLELHNNTVAEIDMGGAHPVAWVNGEAFTLSVQG